MAPEKHRSAILDHLNILLCAILLLFCHGMYASVPPPIFQSSLIADASQVNSKISKSPFPKSSIEISDPAHGTVWTVSEPAKIQWETKNIATSKSIRFFLAKDDMVVQELGSFKNNSLAEGIELAKNVGSGERYQVVGIELFPDNKFQVAKYATSYFSIRNPVADARKKAALAKRSGSDGGKGDPHGQSRSDDLNKNSPARKEFEGRKISYIKELSFTNEEVSVSLWDHGRQDGDIISIYLNGETVVSKHHLTYRRKKVDFKLDASKPNDLFLYAHNLGNAPPNTVSIELTDGATSEKIILNSDLKSCEAVQIRVK
ncbi:MAG TPA: hypothetical protein VFM69_05565 [Pricia sp.]|nr:hypothetical protein [Pricia sp.]